MLRTAETAELAELQAGNEWKREKIAESNFAPRASLRAVAPLNDRAARRARIGGPKKNTPLGKSDRLGTCMRPRN